MPPAEPSLISRLTSASLGQLLSERLLRASSAAVIRRRTGEPLDAETDTVRRCSCVATLYAIPEECSVRVYRGYRTDRRSCLVQLRGEYSAQAERVDS